MKIFILADNIIGREVVKFLKNKGENIVGIAIHPKKYQNKSKEILKLSKNISTFRLGKKISKINLKKIRLLKPDIILVVYWRFLLNKQFINISKYGAVNFHMGYLPYNRGTNPNVWPIIENTPAGCTIHKIDENIDSGSLIVQKGTKYTLEDTAKTLYLRILKDFKKLFETNWHKMKRNKFKGTKIDTKKGSIHYRKQFKNLSKIDLNKKIYPLELFNKIRAKMFEPYEPAYIVYNKKTQRYRKEIYFL